VNQRVREHLLFLREIGVEALDLSRPAPSGDQRPAATGPAAPDGATTEPGDGVHAGAALERLRAEEIGDCRRCKLHEARHTIVFGSGNPQARLMFVGEGPGHDEDIQGLPFVGRAGNLLTQIIQAMGFTRDDVYIANVVKCRPPENRTPQPDETATCSPFLLSQIDIIRPEVIVALGSQATQALLGTSAGITKVRGTFRNHGTDRPIPVMPTFHPAYLLRNPAAKKDVWDDMKKVMALLKGE
jgi:DNA polymerase